jgi:apolipoprotein N-acyltransferase
MHFPQYIRQAAAKNIDILFVTAYDGSAYTPLHAFNNGYRAVENGFTMVRITGDGYSAVIDPYYRLWFAHNSFEQGMGNIYYDVPAVSRKTFYASIGFIFPYVVVLLLISLVILAIVRATKKR